MNSESLITVSCVHGGFVLTTISEEAKRTEVFSSQAKLIKAFRAALEEQSLVAKKGSDDGEAA